MRQLAALAVVGAALPLSACGVGDDSVQVRGVVQRFYAAVRRGDGAGACRQLSGAARAQLESQSGQPCRTVVTRLHYRGGAVSAVEVAMTNAKVDLASGESAFAERTPVGWRVAAAGCEPTGGKPADRPFDCQVQD